MYCIFFILSLYAFPPKGALGYEADMYCMYVLDDWYIERVHGMVDMHSQPPWF